MYIEKHMHFMESRRISVKRKQIYLTEQMDRKLSEIAASRGVPQSEVIREGLELYLQSVESMDKDWDDLIQKMKESPLQNLNWSRDELYAERVRRTSNEQ